MRWKPQTAQVLLLLVHSLRSSAKQSLMLPSQIPLPAPFARRDERRKKHQQAPEALSLASDSAGCGPVPALAALQNKHAVPVTLFF